MRLASLSAGDVVEANVRGLIFRARVERVGRGEVWVRPPRGIGYRRLTARQVRDRVGRPAA